MFLNGPSDLASKKLKVKRSKDGVLEKRNTVNILLVNGLSIPV